MTLILGEVSNYTKSVKAMVNAFAIISEVKPDAPTKAKSNNLLTQQTHKFILVFKLFI